MLMLSCVHDPCVNCASLHYVENEPHNSPVSLSIFRSTHAPNVARKRSWTPPVCLSCRGFTIRRRIRRSIAIRHPTIPTRISPSQGTTITTSTKLETIRAIPRRERTNPWTSPEGNSWTRLQQPNTTPQPPSHSPATPADPPRKQPTNSCTLVWTTKRKSSPISALPATSQFVRSAPFTASIRTTRCRPQEKP